MFCNCLDTQLVTSIENKMNISNTSKKGEVLSKNSVFSCMCMYVYMWQRGLCFVLRTLKFGEHSRS